MSSSARRELESLAQEAAEGKRWPEAEALYRQALEVAEAAADSFGTRYLEGRLADAMLQQGKVQEAKALLEASLVRSETADLPASVQMLVGIYLDEHDWAAAERLLRLAWQQERLAAEEYGHGEPQVRWRLQWLAQSGVKSLDVQPIYAAEGWASEIGDRELWFEIAHERGRLAEARDETEEALEQYRRLAEAGTRYEPTHARLMILLERLGRHDVALAHARSLLPQRWSASFDEQLRKRIQRLERRLAPKGATPAAQAIPAFSVRHGVEAARWAGQIDVKGGAEQVWPHPNGLLVRSGGKTPLLFRVDAARSELDQIRPLPGRSDVFVPPDGVNALLITDLGTVREGRALVESVDAAWRTIDVIDLPAVTSQVASLQWGAAIGCRDGSLYAVDWGGGRRWAHTLPSVDLDPYTRRCPYFVSGHAESGRTVFSSWSDVYCLGADGGVAWIWRVPERSREWRSVFPVDVSAAERATAADLLGVGSNAPLADVRAAFRAKARDTHPDASGDSAEAFVAIRHAYEVLVGSEPGSLGAEVMIRMTMSTIVAAVAATRDGGAFVSASGGQVFRLDRDGRVAYSAVGGDQSAEFLLDGVDRLLAVADFDGVTFLDEGGHPIAAHPAPGRLRLSLSPDEAMIAAYLRKELWLFDRRGSVLSVIEFSRPIMGLAWHDGALVVAAGKLIFLEPD